MKKSFYQMILEASMSYSDALKVFGVSKISSTDELNKVYKQLALKYHPDRVGGSTEKMAQINAAKEILSKSGFYSSGSSSSSSSSSSSGSYNTEWSRKAEEKKFAQNIINLVKKEIRPEAFEKYFEGLYDEKFKAVVTSPEIKPTSYSAMHSAWLKMEISNSSRDIVFIVLFAIDLFELKNGGTVVSSLNSMSLPMTIDVDSYIEGKKQKIVTKGRYDRRTEPTILTDPAVIFTPQRMKKILGGTVRKDSKLKRSDFISFFKNKWKAEIYQPGGTQFAAYVSMPAITDKNYIIKFYRVTLMKISFYSIEGIYEKKSYQYVKIPQNSSVNVSGYLPENKDTLDFIDKMLSDCSRQRTIENLIKTINKYKPKPLA